MIPKFRLIMLIACYPNFVSPKNHGGPHPSSFILDHAQVVGLGCGLPIYIINIWTMKTMDHG